MSDYLVTETELTYEADRIRAKTGGSSPITFVEGKGFGDAIDAIPTGTTPTGTKQISITANGTTTEDVTNYANAQITVNVPVGGGYTAAQIATGSAPSGRVEVASGNITQYALASRPITSLFAPNSTIAVSACISCTSLLSAVVKNLSGMNQFSGCSKITGVDLKSGALTAGSLNSNPVLRTIILRATSVQALQNANALTGTPFKNGGSGGTIYIPKSLYDHLGDNSSLDYKKATNWSTYNGYGTITWAQIEGSIYETQYVDGTPIPTT